MGMGSLVVPNQGDVSHRPQGAEEGKLLVWEVEGITLCTGGKLFGI